MSKLAAALASNRAAQAAEIVLVFGVAVVVVAIGWGIVGENPVLRQAVVWVANVIMLLTIRAGLRVRGQSWAHFGLSLRFPGWRGMVRTVLWSVVVLIAALAAFIAGSMLMANVATGQQNADMSGYNYLRGNLPLLLLALPAVWFVSSFGEEVLYRGFLITRLAEMGGGGKAALRIALVISAVVFGLAHFDWGIVGIVQTTLMGLALAIAYIVSKRNLWTLILAHAYMDTVLFVQMYMGVSAGG